MQERLALAKKRSRDAIGGGGAAKKKVEGGGEAFGQADDDEFMIGDGACNISSSSSSSSSDSDAAGEVIPRLRQIFICSRTHSQLQQVCVSLCLRFVSSLAIASACQRIQINILVYTPLYQNHYNV